MPVGAIAGSAIIGGGVSAYGATKAAGIQADAAARAMGIQQQMFEQARGEARGAVQPFIETGKNAMYSLAQLYGLPGPDGQAGGGAFNDNALEAFRKSPDYDWRLKEGTRALDFSDAARGMLNSSDHLRGVVNYGQGQATQGFNDYAGRLLSLGNIGAGTASNYSGQILGASTQQGQVLGNTAMAQGQAQASGVVGATNAITGAMNNGLNNYMRYDQNQNMLAMYNKMMGSPSAYSGNTPIAGTGGWSMPTSAPGAGGIWPG